MGRQHTKGEQHVTDGIPGRYKIFKLVWKDELVGMIGVWVPLSTENGGVTVHVTNVGVMKQAQKRGFGRRLMQFVLDLYPFADFTLEVKVGNPARKLYESMGFVVTGRNERYYRDGADALVMKRSVKQTNSLKDWMFYGLILALMLLISVAINVWAMFKVYESGRARRKRNPLAPH